MTDQEINKIITEQLMGECWHSRGGFPPDVTLHCEKCGFALNNNLSDYNKDYCTDHNAIAEARAKIEEKHLKAHFIFALDELVRWQMMSLHTQIIWKCLQATPRQQAEAIVKTLENMK